MAIVKMSKIRVIGLLEDKIKVYKFLQNKTQVHIKKVDNFNETKSENTNDKITNLTNKRNNIDNIIKLISSIAKIENKGIKIDLDEFLKIKEKENFIDNMILDCTNLKNSIVKLEADIKQNKDLIITLINNDDNLESLKQNKAISFEYNENCSSKDLIELLKNKNSENENKLKDLVEQLLNYKEHLTDFKLMSDFLSHEIKNLECDNMIKTTETTFILEFYLPSSNEKEIIKDLKALSPTIVCDNIEIDRGETPPTLTKNNKLVRQAEFVTNMYSVPSYFEKDPNTLVFWFFMVFFGYIMADIGIGLTLLVVCYTLAHRIKEDNGSKKLWTLVGTGGIFAIIWGILYNSFFGFSLPVAIMPNTIMPNPQEKAILTLLICLLMGVIHISFAYFMKGLNAIKDGRILDSILDCFLWDTFFIGCIMAATKFLLEFFNMIDSQSNDWFIKLISAVQMPGLIILLVSIGLIALFAGRNTKGFFGKILKTFGSLYGIINLLSDILSYARLFGLMLSGAIIGQQFDLIGVGLISGGSILGIIIGIFVILIGNAFNLAMGALGAFIHDCRLQYIECFGKFYTGEGILFKPFIPEYKYITIESNN